MNTEDRKDELLHQVLQEWKISETLAPRFGERVWQRIARQEQQRPARLLAQLLNRLTQPFIRPALAASYVALLVMAGLGAGFWHARAVNERTSQELGVRYVQMMDPYAPRH